MNFDSARPVWGICSAMVLIVSTTILPNALAEDSACVTNFSESGSWGSGKEFKTWIEIPGGNRDAAFVAIGQAVAAAGFLGLSANKDLGVVTAYQETNGKKSGVTAILTDAGAGKLRAEASFRLAPGLRSPADAVRGELCKLVAAALPADQRAAATASNVFLRRGQENLPLAFESGAQPEDRRSVKLGSAGQIVKVGVTGKADLKPDGDWTVPFAATPDGAGAWQIKPQKDLAPGEYGLWDVEGFALMPFGVD